MSRWTGTWLAGLAGPGVRDPARYPGRDLGLPPEGPGSVAPFGVRAGGFAVDIVLSALIGGLVNVVVTDPGDLARNIAGYVAFAVLTVLSLALAGQTPGQRLLGLRVLPLAGGRPALGLLPAVLRTVVLATLVLALISDGDRRGLHDRLAGTVVVRT